MTENSVFTPRQAFTLKVFHGGELVIRSGQARYVRGKCQYFDWVSLAEMDVSRLYKFATELGYENPGALDYYYKPDNCGGHGFFKEIFGPPDIIKMSTDLDIFRIGVLYMLERPKDDIEDDDDQLQNNRNVEPPTVITISDDAMESEGECEWNESASSGIGCRGGRSTAEHVMSVVGENIVSVFLIFLFVVDNLCI